MLEAHAAVADAAGRLETMRDLGVQAPPPPATKARSSSNELARGQMIIVLARWLLVLAGLMVALWDPRRLVELRIEVGVLLLVAIANFYLHAQLVQRRPTLTAVSRGASIADLMVISLLVALQGPATSNLYVFYFPALLAIAVAFPTIEAAALGAYGVLLYAGLGALGSVPMDVVWLRLLMMSAVVVIGNLYWRLHRDRISASPSKRKEAAQDLFFGQAAALWARWFLVLGGALLVLARATTTDELARNIVPVVVLLFINFFLHGRYLVEKPANRLLTLLASAFDLLLVGAIFLTWAGTPGIGNPAFVLLYPLVFSFALVFPPRVAAAFTTGALALYAVLVLPSGLASLADVKILVERVLVLAALAGLGTIYWRMVRREVRGDADTSDTTATLAWRAANAG
ncbi:MAG TPA: hypothetical protein VFG86_02470 [Chloroflexota bacterium]|nr:hypothetical protein [Chloroflexota bacterium]